MRLIALAFIVLSQHDPGMTAIPPIGDTGDTRDTVVATIGEIVSSRELVGRVVRVTGRCLDVRNLRPIGPPPRTRGDWQLADDSTAVYVTGTVPAACSNQSLVTIVAQVAEDTVQRRDVPGGTPRRYLVRLR